MLPCHLRVTITHTELTFFEDIPSGFFSLGCFPFNNGKIPYAWAYWVPQLVSESTLFLCTLPKTLSVLRGPVKTPYFTYVLLVDSFVYFGGVVAIILLNFIIWSLPSVSVLLLLCRATATCFGFLASGSCSGRSLQLKSYLLPTDLLFFFCFSDQPAAHNVCRVRHVRLHIQEILPTWPGRTFSRPASISQHDLYSDVVFW